jgi:hypothetical protein
MQMGTLCAVLLALVAAAAPKAAAQAASARRVAASTAAAGSAGARGAAKARAAGIPVDIALLASHLEFRNVPVGPPSTASSTIAISPANVGDISMPGNLCSRRTVTADKHAYMHSLWATRAPFQRLRCVCIAAKHCSLHDCNCGLDAGVVVGANSRVAAVPFQAIAADAGFVRPSGRRFSYGGKDFWRECAGSNLVASHRGMQRCGLSGMQHMGLMPA